MSPPAERPLHVVHIFGTLLPGGAERQALALVRYSDPTVVRFSAINCCAAEHLLAPEFAAAGCPVMLLDKFSMSYPTFLWKLRRMLRDLKPDVAHTWLYAPCFWGRFAAITAGVRGIVASTRTGSIYSRWYEAFIDRTLSRRTAVRIVNSEGVRDSLVQRVGLRPESIRVIYNGVDAERLAPRADRATLRSRFGWPVDAPVLLSVGRLVREKNYPMLLRAISSLRERTPTLRAAIAGWGAAHESLLALREEMNLTKCVEFLGRREDVADLMTAADLFVMPSLSEGFSNALLEAMWVGLPVVATRVNGAVEIIRDGENGLLVDIGDEQAFAAAIADLLADRARRDRVGRQASTDVRHRFSIDRMVAEHLESYRVAAAGRT